MSAQQQAASNLADKVKAAKEILASIEFASIGRKDRIAILKELRADIEARIAWQQKHQRMET